MQCLLVVTVKFSTVSIYVHANYTYGNSGGSIEAKRRETKRKQPLCGWHLAVGLCKEWPRPVTSFCAQWLRSGTFNSQTCPTEFHLHTHTHKSSQVLGRPECYLPRYLHVQRDETQTLETSVGCKSPDTWDSLTPGDSLFIFQKVKVRIWRPFCPISKGQRFFFLLSRQRRKQLLLSCT